MAALRRSALMERLARIVRRLMAAALAVALLGLVVANWSGWAALPFGMVALLFWSLAMLELGTLAALGEIRNWAERLGAMAAPVNEE